MANALHASIVPIHEFKHRRFFFNILSTEAIKESHALSSEGRNDLIEFSVFEVPHAPLPRITKIVTTPFFFLSNQHMEFFPISKQWQRRDDEMVQQQREAMTDEFLDNDDEERGIRASSKRVFPSEMEKKLKWPDISLCDLMVGEEDPMRISLGSKRQVNAIGGGTVPNRRSSCIAVKREIEFRGVFLLKLLNK